MSKSFIESIARAATEDMAASGILASITIAQACLESSYGTSELATDACNLFGMKAVLSGNAWESSWDGSTYIKHTKEQDTAGNECSVTATFRKYQTPEQSIKDHSDYLNGAMDGDFLRYEGLSRCSDYRTAAQLIKNGGYATDTQYVDKLCSLIEAYNLTQYDERSNTMQISDALLTISGYNRPGTKRACTTAIACHYIGNPGTSAQANRNYFENLRTTHTTKASCHYIIGLKGEILRLIPEDEISWCTNAANSYTISIEACHPDSTGKFNDATYQSYVALCADLCKRWKLDPLTGGLIRHYDVNTKICPKYFVDNPAVWAQFKKDVANMMQAQALPLKSGWVEEDGIWRFYLGDTGECVKNEWYEDNEKWYWFDGSGRMITKIWYMYNNGWYYLGSDGAMLKGLQNIDGKWYYLDKNGKMATEPVLLTPDNDGALKYPGIES